MLLCVYVEWREAMVSGTLTQIIHEDLSVIMAYAFSRKPLDRLLEKKFPGGWKYLEKALFDYAEARATRACLELALLLRHLDNEEKYSSYLKKSNLPFGRFILPDGSDDTLTLREVCNKIIHASNLDWDCSDEEDPVLISTAEDKQKWVRAEIKIVSLAAACGGLIS